MLFRRIMLLGALAAGFLLAAGTSSQAAYSYTTAITITTVTGITPSSGSSFTGGGTPSVTVTAGGGTTTVTFSNVGNTNQGYGASTLNIGNLAVTTTATSPVGFTVQYTDLITITNGGSNGTFTINGTLSLSGVTTTGGNQGTVMPNQFSGTFTQTQVIGGNSFTMNFGTGAPNDLYQAPTVNGSGGGGGISANITSVPEPASVALLATGLVGLLGVGLHRRGKRPNPSP